MKLLNWVPLLFVLFNVQALNAPEQTNKNEKVIENGKITTTVQNVKDLIIKLKDLHGHNMFYAYSDNIYRALPSIIRLTNPANVQVEYILKEKSPNFYYLRKTGSPHPVTINNLGNGQYSYYVELDGLNIELRMGRTPKEVNERLLRAAEEKSHKITVIAKTNKPTTIPTHQHIQMAASEADRTDTFRHPSDKVPINHKPQSASSNNITKSIRHNKNVNSTHLKLHQNYTIPHNNHLNVPSDVNSTKVKSKIEKLSSIIVKVHPHLIVPQHPTHSKPQSRPVAEKNSPLPDHRNMEQTTKLPSHQSPKAVLPNPESPKPKVVKLQSPQLSANTTKVEEIYQYPDDIPTTSDWLYKFPSGLEVKPISIDGQFELTFPSIGNRLQKPYQLASTGAWIFQYLPSTFPQGQLANGKWNFPYQLPTGEWVIPYLPNGLNGSELLNNKIQLEFAAPAANDVPQMLQINGQCQYPYQLPSGQWVYPYVPSTSTLLKSKTIYELIKCYRLTNNGWIFLPIDFPTKLPQPEWNKSPPSNTLPDLYQYPNGELVMPDQLKSVQTFNTPSGQIELPIQLSNGEWIFPFSPIGPSGQMAAPYRNANGQWQLMYPTQHPPQITIPEQSAENKQSADSTINTESTDDESVEYSGLKYETSQWYPVLNNKLKQSNLIEALRQIFASKLTKQPYANEPIAVQNNHQSQKSFLSLSQLLPAIRL